MKNLLLFGILACALAGCTKSDNGVRVSTVKPEAAAPAPVVQEARTEPIFYNGKNYRLKFAPIGKGVYDLAVLDMTAKQQKDATNIATSAIRYFACPDGKTGKLVQQPSYVDGTWRMSARCG
jgi:hypothetical protein